MRQIFPQPQLQFRQPQQMNLNVFLLDPNATTGESPVAQAFVGKAIVLMINT